MITALRKISWSEVLQIEEKIENMFLKNLVYPLFGSIKATATTTTKKKH